MPATTHPAFEFAVIATAILASVAVTLLLEWLSLWGLLHLMPAVQKAATSRAAQEAAIAAPVTTPTLVRVAVVSQSPLRFR